jgi:hypothetical protein
MPLALVVFQIAQVAEAAKLWRIERRSRPNAGAFSYTLIPNAGLFSYISRRYSPERSLGVIALNAGGCCCVVPCRWWDVPRGDFSYQSRAVF